ncbi:MAG: ferritin-like domain-containing protein [candidate division Zixibacteria bacterium]|nr:ferritin-like domain-containing protein [candidate division Zixibacteria bacterium]
MENSNIVDNPHSDSNASCDTSRRYAVKKSLALVGAGLALTALPLGMGKFSRKAFAQTGLTQQVIDVLNFALTLEFLENEFYNIGLATAGLIPAADRPVFMQISKHETAHVALLQSTLGGQAISKPTFDFTAGGTLTPFTDYNTFRVLSQAFEDTGVRAYKGQAGNLIGNKPILTVALQIHSVEARHAAEVRRFRGLKGWITGNQNDVPTINAVYAGEENRTQAGVELPNTSAASEAFDEPLTRAQVMAIADPFIVS